jgi:uncharacterized membrane protein
MRKAANIIGLLLCGIISLALAWIAVKCLGIESVRSALRFATAPAIFLGGFAATLLGKVHDLTEISGIPVQVIDRIAPLVKRIHIRLWILIGLIAFATVGGWVIASVDAPYAISHTWVAYGSIFCLAILIAVTIVEIVYLPMLHMDYSGFRMKAIRDFRDSQSREDALKKLKSLSEDNAS